MLIIKVALYSFFFIIKNGCTGFNFRSEHGAYLHTFGIQAIYYYVEWIYYVIYIFI